MISERRQHKLGHHQIGEGGREERKSSRSGIEVLEEWQSQISQHV